MSTYPVQYTSEYVEPRSRLTTFFRLVLAIPHFFLAAAYGFAAGVVIVLAWFAMIFTGRYPSGMYDFVAGFLRYQTRTYGYLFLLTDEYPPFTGSASTDYPVDLRIGPPKAQYSRAKAFFRLILAIPVFVILYAMQIVGQIGALLAWFAILILGRQPQGLQEMTDLGLSYQQRALAYLALLTEDWPPFSGEGSAAALTPATAPGGGLDRAPETPVHAGFIAPAAASEHSAPSTAKSPPEGLAGGDPLQGA